MSNPTIYQVYCDAQKGYGLKVGDWVKVLREPFDFEAGWNDVFTIAKATFIGQVCKITSIHPTKGLYLRDNADIYPPQNFPYFVLEKVAPPSQRNSTFKPFDKVLVRTFEREAWSPDIFAAYAPEESNFPFKMISGSFFRHCIPYAGNEDLAGTTFPARGCL